MRFLDGLKRANLCSLRVMGQPVVINDVEMNAAFDDATYSQFARPGGRTEDVDMGLFVKIEDFEKAKGKKGVRVIYPPTGFEGKVDKIANFQGVLYLTVSAFRP